MNGTKVKLFLVKIEDKDNEWSMQCVITDKWCETSKVYRNVKYRIVFDI